MELALQLKFIQKSITDLNSASFTEHFTKYIETNVHCSKNYELLSSTFDVVAPTREKIPILDYCNSSEPMVEQVARESVLEYGIHAILVEQSTEIWKLEIALVNHFGNTFPGKSVFDYWNNEYSSLSGLDRSVAQKVKIYLRSGHFAPYDFYLAGFRFLEWINECKYRDFLLPALADWQRSGWGQILERQRFRIIDPRITVPAIAECLKVPGEDRSFITELLLVASHAAGVRLSSENRTNLIDMKKDSY